MVIIMNIYDISQEVFNCKVYPGEEIQSSFDQMSMELMLSECGFLVYEHLNYNEIQNRFFQEEPIGYQLLSI